MDYKKILCFVLSFVLIFTPSSVVFAENIHLDAKSAILLEPISGKVLFEQNSNERLAPASITKIMTILLIYEAVESGKIKWDDIVTVSEHAASMGGSQIFLEPMEQQTVKDLTKSIVIASANDSSVAMAEFISGSEEAFVSLMNERAKELGMENTNFLNSCGLDVDNHYSSAYDIALMTKELINNHQEVFEYTKTWQDTIIHKTKRGEQEFGLTNTNKLIKRYTGATGLKTGSTSKALFCLSATAERDGMGLVAVILGAPDPNVRFSEIIKMLDYGFASFSVAQGDEEGSVKGTIPILKGEKDELDVVVKDKFSVVVEKGNSKKLDSEIELLPALNAPVLSGTKAGEVVYSYDGNEVGRSDLIITEDVQIANITKIMQKLIKQWFND